jgi:hypothetical protein
LIVSSEERSTYPQDSEEYEMANKLVSTINTTVLRVIANGELNLIYLTLFDLLKKSRSVFVPAKFDSLVVKCLAKMTNNIEEDSDLDLSGIFLRMHYYMLALLLSERDTKDDVGVKIIKTVITKLIDKFEERRIILAVAPLKDPDVEDDHILKWTTVIMNNKYGKTDKSAIRSGKVKPAPGRTVAPKSPEYHSRSGSSTKQQAILKIVSRFKVNNLPLNEYPKIARDLTEYLKTLEEEIDITPFLKDLDEKPKMFLIRDVNKFYQKLNNPQADNWDTKSRVSHSDSRSHNQSIQNRAEEVSKSSYGGGEGRETAGPTRSTLGSKLSKSRAVLTKPRGLEEDQMKQIEEVKRRINGK